MDANKASDSAGVQLRKVINAAGVQVDGRRVVRTVLALHDAGLGLELTPHFLDDRARRAGWSSAGAGGVRCAIHDLRS